MLAFQTQTNVREFCVFFITYAMPHYTVEHRYNKDPVITKNIRKPGRITVKYVETNPTITNRF